MGLVEAAVAIIVPFVLLWIIYSLGKVSKRETGREPYVSGHQFPSTWIPYRPEWLYYISYFILWDIIVIFMLFTWSGFSPVFMATLIILISAMLLAVITLLPYRRRVIRK